MLTLSVNSEGIFYLWPAALQKLGIIFKSEMQAV
jgi:hypothetical protein